MCEINSHPSVTIRAATIADCDAIVALRTRLFEALGYDDVALDHMASTTRDYIQQHLPSGGFRVWLAECGDLPVASIGLVMHSFPPTPRNLVGKEGYIMNLITQPPYRRRGIARALLSHVLDVLKQEGIPRASLHASSAGQLLYKQLGFEFVTDVPEMRRLIP